MQSVPGQKGVQMFLYTVWLKGERARKFIMILTATPVMMAHYLETIMKKRIGCAQEWVLLYNIGLI